MVVSSLRDLPGRGHPWRLRSQRHPGDAGPARRHDRHERPGDRPGRRLLHQGAHRAGASVTAVDYAAKDFYGFAAMERLAERPFKFIRANVYELDTLPIEPFDVVICLGVLYHLPDMCKALWSLRQFTKSRLILETLVSRKHEDEPFAEYLPADSNNADYTNFWAPNPKCCEMMLADAGFIVESSWINDSRGMFHCAVHPEEWATKKMRVAYDYLTV
uniref:DUF1698 domain-containing protein n=1 Tax=Phenylobacterium glaciei TaxID=2803784 RepID=A0A974P5W0_9CAUL|nr:DUF1698 domain-containing protein [Phenylobacterium glaciei]